MVSLELIFKRYKYLFLLASLFILGGATKSFAAADISMKVWVCLVGQTKCCVNGEQSCCDDDGTLYDTWSCDEISCGISGLKQYKYTADSDCGYSTSTRTCCSSGSWSGWDAACPATPKTCSSSTKPDTETTCTGGYKTRSVTCNTSTGEWTTGSWGDCDCSDSEYESVITISGGSCCQRIDGTGVRCAVADLGTGYRWVSGGTNCWDKSECGSGCPSNLSDGLACSESQVGSWCSKWDYSVTDVGCDGQFIYRNGPGMCRQYMCRG